jgi:hypothetical protein
VQRIAQASQSERAALFREATRVLGWRNVRIVEKDYWVCWTLDCLFKIPGMREHLVFKGGTSLSKVHHLIERFSEDIDLCLDPAELNFDSILGSDLSRTQLDKQWKLLAEACYGFASSTILPALRKAAQAIPTLNSEKEHGWRIEPDRQGFPLLLFRYPAGEQARDFGYIGPEVKIELGSLTDQVPLGDHSIMPYVAQALPELKAARSGPLTVLEVERTFWEKATILHNEYFRPESSGTAERISRHFYDLAMLANSSAGQRALGKPEWLERVVEHKQRFFKTGWSSFETARRGTFHLLPSDARCKALRSDYDRMDEMFFTAHPSFEAILEILSKLEQALNA